MKDDDEIDEFAAAALVQMSPVLLKSFSSRAPKQGETRKLPFKQTGTHRTYSRKELLAFDAYLRKPWPAPEGARPPIPLPIQKEVRGESALQCAICHSNADTCEIAHIEPVASSKCNHPHNLILLCANHHTKFDKQGVWGPKEEAREYVASFKKTLLYISRVKWGSHASSIAECFSIAQLCAHLKKELEAVQNQVTAEQVGYYEHLAEEAVSRLRQSAIKGKLESRKQKATSTPDELWTKLESSVQKSTPSARLSSAAALTQDKDFRAAAGFVDCPLCEGNGFYNDSVCPVCAGERQVEKTFAKRVDLEPYELVKCPLCKASGKHEGEDCPVCHGDRRIERRFAERVDLADFDEVPCPLCKGTGRWDGEDCPECRGNRTMPRRYADQVDVLAHEKVKCPICNGSGVDNEGDSCRACAGDGQLTRAQSDRLDPRDYERVKCRLCKGSGQFGEGDCPPCGGEGTLPRWAEDRTDWREFDLVECPRCHGSGSYHDNDCPKCAGERRIFRRYAEDD